MEQRPKQEYVIEQERLIPFTLPRDPQQWQSIIQKFIQKSHHQIVVSVTCIKGETYFALPQGERIPVVVDDLALGIGLCTSFYVTEPNRITWVLATLKENEIFPGFTFSPQNEERLTIQALRVAAMEEKTPPNIFRVKQ
ncbi:hypothetical protein MO867_17760 [Microbulbifer sp. OS29]|uniref:Uncharacterized protein n=2 Tax=Microbulbifer okhotskensis TaxID=2926617 RepID=A0A9X2J7V4_9GAMM|nr:hypothetical protein [Microbulbifer okhotskensis]